MPSFDKIAPTQNKQIHLYFSANKGLAASKMDSAARLRQKLRDDFAAFAQQFGGQVIAITQGRDTKEQIVALGIRAADGRLPEGEWEKIAAEGIYIAKAGSEFDLMQGALVERNKFLPSANFAQVLAEGREERSNMDCVHPNSLAVHLDTGWLFIVHDHLRGVYKPPGSTAIKERAEAKKLYDGPYLRYGEKVVQNYASLAEPIPSKGKFNRSLEGAHY